MRYNHFPLRLLCRLAALGAWFITTTPSHAQNKTEVKIGLPPLTQMVTIDHRPPSPQIRWTSRETLTRIIPAQDLGTPGRRGLLPSSPNKYKKIVYTIRVTTAPGFPPTSYGYEGTYTLTATWDPVQRNFEVFNNWENLPMWAGFPRGHYRSAFGLDESFSTRNTPDPGTTVTLTDTHYHFTSTGLYSGPTATEGYVSEHDLVLSERAEPLIIPEREEHVTGPWTNNPPSTFRNGPEWSSSEYRLIAPPNLMGSTVHWVEVFTSFSPPYAREYTGRSWLVNAAESPPFQLTPPAQNGTKTISLLPLQIDSRDRGIAGLVTIPEGASSFVVSVDVDGRGIGSFDVLDAQTTHIYSSEEALFSDEEVTRYEAKDSATLRAINQPIAFIRDGAALRFCTVADTIGTLNVRLTLDGHVVATVSRQMAADAEFARVLTAVEGMVAGDPAPPVKLDADFPTLFTPPPVPFSRPALEDLLALAPVGPVNELRRILQSDSTSEGLPDAELFYYFIRQVDFEPVAAPDGNPSTWTAERRDHFFNRLRLHYYYPLATDLQSQRARAASPPLEIELPAVIRNRGLVAKSLLFFINRAITGQMAYAEGAVFGIWDGIKGDVEGVIQTLRMPLDIVNVLLDPYKAAGELWHTFKAVKEAGWEGVLASLRGMLDEFVGDQKERLKLLLPGDSDNPEFLAAYFAGYVTGFIAEQVGVALATAGIGKIGWFGQALKKGRTVVKSMLASAGPADARVHKTAKSVSVEFGRTASKPDHIREARRTGSLTNTTTGCFAAGTLVVMENGTLKPIESIRSGDRVLTHDTNSATAHINAVVNQVFYTASSTLRISWDQDDDGAADDHVSATPGHPFWVEDGRWLAARSLENGMKLRTASGASATIVDITSQQSEIASYNLDVGGPNTFFVGSTARHAVLVHNREGEVYFYGDPTKIPDQSQFYKKVPDQPFSYVPIFHDPPTNTNRRLETNPQHHFFYDAWLRARFTNLPTVDGRVRFPSIELTRLQHSLVHEIGDELLEARFQRNARQMTTELWKQIEPEEMQEIAEQMLRRTNELIAQRYPGASQITDVDAKLHRLKRMGLLTLNVFRKRNCP